MKKLTFLAGIVTLLFSLQALAAYEDYNKRYGEYRFGKLPEKAAVSKTVWVGQWWSYKKDGVATRFGGTGGVGTYEPIADAAKARYMSPAEKLDKYLGRYDKIDFKAIKDYLDKKKAVESDVDQWIEERRELVYKLNRMIEEKSGDTTFKWQDTEEGKKYVDLGKKIEEKQGELKKISLTVDTAYEWEVINHGNGQFGVQYWWGHCNAWAGAACVEPEPAKEATIKDIPFNPGDVKGLLTESWMECNSSFFGTRNEHHDNAEDREKIDYKDVTPAAFHIFFADQIGNRDKAFVIDEFTGQEVWNQPVKAYWAKCEPQYEIGQDGKAVAEKVDVTLTNYGGWYGGTPALEKLGEKSVYPVLCSTTIHWMSDGVAHDAVTARYEFDKMTYDNFTSGSWVHSQLEDHVDLRTLTYVLWLDKPMTDSDARIIGDGQWNHGATYDYAHAHPDFLWQPTANSTDGGRDYENPYVDYDVLAKEILPLLLKDAENPEVPATGEFASTDTPMDIPDGTENGDPGAPAVSVIKVDSAAEIGNMEVDVDITHTYIGDLRITLSGPNGKEAVLKKFDEGSSADDIRKSYDVKEFNGLKLAGDWTLTVVDTFAQDTGRINSWKIRVK